MRQFMQWKKIFSCYTCHTKLSKAPSLMVHEKNHARDCFIATIVKKSLHNCKQCRFIKRIIFSYVNRNKKPGQLQVM